MQALHIWIGRVAGIIGVAVIGVAMPHASATRTGLAAFRSVRCFWPAWRRPCLLAWAISPRLPSGREA